MTAVRVALALSILCWAGRAGASPEDLFGYGARTNAMGATGTAHASDGEAAWHNPALASGIRSNHLVLGYVAGLQDWLAGDVAWYRETRRYIVPGGPGWSAPAPAKAAALGMSAFHIVTGGR